MSKKVHRFFVPESGTPYRELAADRQIFSAYTIAALVAIGAIRVSPKGLATKGQRRFTDAIGAFRAIVGKTAASYWTRTGRITPSGITVKGLNEVTARLSGKGSYKTTAERVSAILAAIREGGAVELSNGTKVPFSAEIGTTL